MAAYIIIHIEVTDPEQYRAYTNLTPAIVAHYGGRFI
ncbi:MAG: DUF1330 domain-containing protein, partial [Anaerolineae bacterium]|nr:DUF1330 domain-containing protein [Anaerolineae bacterium]